MAKEYFQFLLFNVICFIGVHSYTSVAPTWLTSPYFRAGNQMIISSATGNSSKPAFVFTFSSALPGVPNLAYGIKNYRAVDTMKALDFEVRRENLTASTFGVSIQSANVSNIFNLAIAYLAVDPLFPHHLNSFDNVALNYSTPTLTNLSILSMSATYHTETINYTQQSALNTYKTFGSVLSSNKIMLFLTSFSSTCFGKETLQFSISSTVLNTSHYQLTGRAFYNVSIKKVRFSQVIYNEDDVTSSKLYAIVNQFWDVLNPGGYASFPQTLTDNMILAMTDFQATLGECGFEYNWDFMSNYNNLSYAILIAASIPSTKAPYKSAATCGLNYTHSTLFYIKTWKCVSPYNYFNLTTNLCQDACSSYYYQNTILSSCDTCYYACYNCSVSNVSTACTSCQAGLNRVLVNGSCLCASGYFDDWYSPGCRACSVVDSNCLTCTYNYNTSKTSSAYQAIFASTSWPTDIKPDYKCTLCKPTYFVNSSYLCQSCPLSYCTLCANLTACQTCDSSVNATKYTDNLCYLCNVANCAICSSNNVCAQCSAGFILQAGACLSCSQACNCGGWVLPMVNGVCSTQCGDGYKLGAQQCDDGNLNDHDGCSSTCTNETCNVSCGCDGWVLPWVNANSSCTTVCGDGYKRGIEQCDDGNTNDHDGCSSTCTTQACNVSCSCDGWILPWVNSNFSCTTVCGDGFVRGVQQCDDGNIINNDGCSSTCTFESCNTSCNCDGWTYPFVSGLCSTICGDNLLRGSELCDDGNTNDHDGCSSTCQTQSCNVSCQCDGWTLPWLSALGACSTTCGDGLLRGTEQCDDGNTNDHDGCSSTCMTETCNVSCLCNGWSLPWTNGSCSTVCGDGILQGSQTCDDGNLIDHDGCSSSCQIETCTQNCSCDGWQLPWVNGSCSSICGDSLLRGSQQCDDGNQIDTDFCFNNCTSNIITPVEDPVLLSSSMSIYPALGLFVLGFRIVGLEALNVFQSFQLLLYSQGIESFVLSFNVHGYSDPTYFPMDIPSQNHIFGHFNFMYLLLITLFAIGAALEIYNKTCNAQNKVNNEFDPNKQIDEKIEKNDTGEVSIEEHTDDFGDFTVHYKADDGMMKKQKTHMNVSQVSDHTQPEQPPFWGSVLFRQIFFDLVVNCQCVFVFTLVQQIIKGSTDSFLNFPTFAAIMSMVFVLVVILAICVIERQGFGQNHMKFHKNKPIVYWSLMLGEKIVFAAILGVKSLWGIYVVLGVKTVLVTYYIFAQLYFERIQKVRSVCTHALHLLLILMVVLNDQWLKPQNILTSISRFSIEYAYAFVLSTVLLICLAFYVREFMYQCAADFRKQQEPQCPIVVKPPITAIFDVKQDDTIEQSCHPFNFQSIKGSGLFEDLKTKKMIPRSSIHLQVPSEALQKDDNSKNLISISCIRQASPIGSFNQSRSEAKSKHSYQTHRRSHLNDVSVNVFTNNVVEEQDEIKQEDRLKLKATNKQNLDMIKEDESRGKASIEEKTSENYHNETSDHVLQQSNSKETKTHRRFGLKNRNKKKEDWASNVLKTQESEPAYETANKNGQKPLNGFSMTGEVFHNSAKNDPLTRTFSNSKRQYKLKKPFKKGLSFETQILNVQSFEHTDIHNEGQQTASISFS